MKPKVDFVFQFSLFRVPLNLYNFQFYVYLNYFSFNCTYMNVHLARLLNTLSSAPAHESQLLARDGITSYAYFKFFLNLNTIGIIYSSFSVINIINISSQFLFPLDFKQLITCFNN